jgi:23S rRNA (cytosine1962-C5)-methyltransferase
VIIDRFGEVALVHLFESPELARTQELMRRHGMELLKLYGVAALYGWVHRRDARESATGGAELFAGSPREAVWCTEGRLRFLIKPEANVNGGLFLDTRAIRHELAHSSAAHRVLNTFCFTGSLGIAAWCGGAKEVVQVDISKGILNWARENFAGNVGGGSGEMRFIAEDSLTFMERELRRIERGDRRGFDTVIVDPPSFGSSRGTTFSFQADIEKVLTAALRLLVPGGRLFFTTNFRRMTVDELKSTLDRASDAAAKKLTDLQPLYPPAEDFTALLADSFAMRGFRAVIASSQEGVERSSAVESPR